MKIILFILLTAFSLSIQSQDTLILSHQITLPDSGFLNIDQMQNIYVVKGPEIIKINPKGEILNRYSDNILGNITSIDITNPLQILVFYRDQSKIVFLDNTLSEQKQGISTLNISDSYITQACNSNNGGFWVYNASSLELQKRDKSSGIGSTSNNLSLVVGQQIEPTFLKERNNIIQVVSDSSLYLFDNQVNFIKNIPLKDSQFLNYKNNILSTYKGLNLYYLNTITYESNTYVLPLKGCKKNPIVYSSHDFVYTLKGKTLNTYKIP